MIPNATLESKIATLPLPSFKDEDYRFLGLRAFRFEEWPPSATRPNRRFDASSVERCEPDEAAVIVVRSNGEVKVEVSAAGLAKGVIVRGLANSDDILKTGVPKAFERDRFAWVTAARAENGALIVVPKHVQLEKPIRILTVGDATEVAYVRHRIILEEGAEASIVEESVGVDDALSVCGLTEIVAGRGSKLRYASVQAWGDGTQYFTRQHFAIASEARVEWIGASHGGSRGQARAEIMIEGKNASFAAMTAVRGHREQVFDQWVSLNHLAPHATSKMDTWTVMADRARAVFNGKIVIPREAPQTDATQKSRTLLLSSNAVVDVIPKLEIATDDVKCAHGASVSPVSAEQLYYLMSRGIPTREAETMIVQGFTEPVLERLPTMALRDRVTAAFAAKRGCT